ncbi:hypothetical protein [Metabacillus rhizolycopersici]|uniref:Uncharacterized protein n=1 Tax=Metabacillus rhizolycopersici TaxID=2875709 RepID=A0ABS7UM12_9BACI|nr:hypothetical protein [Metabacillus rhizolycopersici]MBZ5748899.1 hypothetical protein [Metabacillus rhizolycopersici]
MNYFRVNNIFEKHKRKNQKNQMEVGESWIGTLIKKKALLNFSVDKTIFLIKSIGTHEQNIFGILIFSQTR